MIVLFVVLIPNFFLLWLYTDTIDYNIFSATFWFFKVRSAPFWFFKICNTISQVFKVRFVFRNIFYKTHGYFLDIISCCECAFVRWVEDFFAAFINTNITITWFHRFFVKCIYTFFLFSSTRGLLFALVIIRTQIIFMFVCFIFPRTRYTDAFWFFLIHQNNPRLIFSLACFVLTTSNLTLWVRSRTCFFILGHLEICLTDKK